MRGLSWFLALLGVAQFGVIAYTKPTGYVSVDMAYLVMALFILAAVALWAFSWCCGWGYGCGCDHCEDCSGGECCGHCGCEGEESHSHEGNGHEGHSH
jgi:hypothetical protein